MVRINLPPPSRPPIPIYLEIPEDTKLFRIYDPTRYGQSCLSFRRFGPVARFDHQRHSELQPGIDPERGIYYGAQSISSCVVEVFGDTGLIVYDHRHLALLRTTRTLRLLDLCGNGAMCAGTVAAISKTEHILAQSWSRYFYEEPAYQQPDGICYLNAHNDELAVALYERSEDALECIQELRLDDPALLAPLAFIAKVSNLVISRPSQTQ